jgi:hypothetical protein
MPILNEVQRQRALEVMREYLAAPPGPDGKTWVENEATWDENRVTLIEKELKPLLVGYLEGRIPLSDFKSKVDGINKSNTLWGFRGVKGQMFFNMVVNVADDLNECDQELKAALAAPVNDQIASSRIKTFASYVKRLGDQWVEAGNTGHGAPKIGSIPFFLSYFWQIQDQGVWPVYYTNSVQTVTDLNLWQPSGDIAEDFLTYKGIQEELVALFTESSPRPFGLYDVEHVFWFKGGNPYEAVKTDFRVGLQAGVQSVAGISGVAREADRLPEGYVPPIVAILPRMACHEEVLVEAARRSGTTLERAFEKGVDAAFTILGYETKLLGQGKGRVPDGHALANDDNYAILWDAKVRSNGYSMGTDDRTIREYVTKQSRELKRSRFLRNIYYLIISSKFSDDYDDAIRSIKMETDVNEVSLVEAEALVAMVDLKLRAPLSITLGPDGLQRLFTFSGVLTSEMVREFLS